MTSGVAPAWLCFICLVVCPTVSTSLCSATPSWRGTTARCSLLLEVQLVETLCRPAPTHWTPFFPLTLVCLRGRSSQLTLWDMYFAQGWDWVLLCPKWTSWLLIWLIVNAGLSKTPDCFTSTPGLCLYFLKPRGGTKTFSCFLFFFKLISLSELGWGWVNQSSEMERVLCCQLGHLVVCR